MKLVMLTALAVLATPALAQTTPPPADPPMAQPMPTPPAPPPAPADPAMAQPMATPAAPAAPMSPAMPMTTPDANASAAMPAAPMPASGSYPKCSKTVIDQCTERSNARGERMHSTPRPKK